MANIISVQTPNVSTASQDVCQKFEITIRVVNAKTSGTTLNNFLFVLNENTPFSKNINFSNADVVSEDGSNKTFEKTIDVLRSQTYPWTYNAYFLSGIIVGSQFASGQISSLFPSAWNITGLTVTTDVNDVGSVSVETTPVFGLSAFLGIEISVNDVDYFDTNVITGLSAGNYTLYVRDQYNCKKSTAFVVSSEPSFEVYNDFKFVSLLNPVPFTAINENRPSFFNTPSYKTDDNHLSQNNNYEYLQTDTLRFQFRSNYEINKAFLINCGEIVEELVINKKSDNLNQRDNRDARFYFENGFLYAYYDGTGSIYDNEGNVIGNNTLNGSLLFDQVQGELLSIDTLGIVEILEVVSVDGIGQVMKLNFTQPIVNDYLKITTYYNAENFEVYEFDLSLARDLDNYQVVIVNNSASEFDELNPLTNASFISEVITIVDAFSDEKFKFVWKNSENNQFSWDTGIECFNYLPKTFEPTFKTKDENEIYTTDTTSFMLESEVYDLFEFTIERISQIQARQLMLIASNDYLKIDDNFYVKEETPEANRLGVSNAYNVIMILQLASNYNSNEREGLTNNANTVDTNGFLRIY